MSGRKGVHRYRAELAWTGSTGTGYDHYDRVHRVAVPPASDGWVLSADPVFGGEAALANPEQLLVAAASSCQLLSFLAVAARARIDVVGYTDRAHGEMPEDVEPMQVTRIVLRPHVIVAGDPSDERLVHLTEVAHRQCFIANSLRSDIVVEPTFERSPAA